MAEAQNLAVRPRTVLGKKVSTLRRQGILPGVIFGGHADSLPIETDLHAFEQRYRRWGNTTLLSLSGIDGGEVVKMLRDRFGITIAGGQGDLKGKIVRIGHIGWFDVFDVATALSALELALAELGADVERGVAASRALSAFEHAPA